MSHLHTPHKHDLHNDGGNGVGTDRRLQSAPTTLAPPPLLPPFAPQSDLGTLELWASDTSSFFGERVLTIADGVSEHTTTMRVDHATPRRYWTLRMYHADRRMRLDSLRLFGTRSDGSAAPSPPVCELSYAEPGRRAQELRVFDALLNRTDSPLESYDQLREALRALFGLELPSEDVLNAAGARANDDASSSSNSSSSSSNSSSNSSNNWWDVLEEHHDDLDDTGVFNVYPLRAPPGAHGASPASSLVVALALTNAPPDGVPSARGAEHELLNRTCAHLGGCEHHDHLLETSPLLDEAFQPYYPQDATARNDGAWLNWLISASVAPVVSLIALEALPCASDDLCGQNCDVCEGALSNAGHAAVYVVRAVEAALVGGGTTTVDPIECVQSSECVHAAAASAAAALGTIALPSVAAVANVTNANAALWAFAREDAGTNVSFVDERQPRRAAVAEAHVAAIGRDIPPWVRKHVVGRRLEEGTDDAPSNDTAWYAKLTKTQKLLHVASSLSAHRLRTNASLRDLTDAHMRTLRAWAAAGPHAGERANRTGVCADPHYANRTVSCKVHMVLIANELKGKRQREAAEAKRSKTDGGRRRMQADNENELKAAIHTNLDGACCARFGDGSVECNRKYCEHHIRQESTKRMALVLRRRAEQGDPKAHRVGPDIHAIIENVLLPELHSDPECRVVNESSLYFGGPTRNECMARSLLHHAKKKYGFSTDKIEKKMQEYGLSAGRGMQQIQQTFGIIKEVSSAGSGALSKVSRRDRLRGAAGKRAAAMLRAANGGSGRRLAEATTGMRARAARTRNLQTEEDALSDEEVARRRVASRGTDVDRHTHGFAHAALSVKQTRNTARNVSALVGHHFGRLEKLARSDRLRRLNQGRAGGGRTDPVPRVDSFHTDNLRQHVRSPLLVAEILAADEGSLASRLSGGVRKLAGVAKRWSEVNFQAELTRVQRERRRRLSDEDGSKRQLGELYDELERQQKAREAARREALMETTEGRRLHEDDVRRRVEAPELPAHHTFSWLHELVDWRAAADEWTRVHDLMTKRHELRMQGHGMEEILQSTATGYHVLDSADSYAFSKVGDALRRLWHRKVNGTDEHFVNHTKSHVDRAAKHAPASHGRMRRLSEGFFGPVVSAPFAIWDTTLYAGRTPAPIARQSKDNVVVALLRWLIYGTVGCYGVKPQANPVSSSLGSNKPVGESDDGESMKVLRPPDERICFPVSKYTAVLTSQSRCMLPCWRWTPLSFFLCLLCTRSPLHTADAVDVPRADRHGGGRLQRAALRGVLRRGQLPGYGARLL